jgi:hypothetical protein
MRKVYTSLPNVAGGQSRHSGVGRCILVAILGCQKDFVLGLVISSQISMVSLMATRGIIAAANHYIGGVKKIRFTLVISVLLGLLASLGALDVLRSN